MFTLIQKYFLKPILKREMHFAFTFLFTFLKLLHEIKTCMCWYVRDFLPLRSSHKYAQCYSWLVFSLTFVSVLNDMLVNIEKLALKKQKGGRKERGKETKKDKKRESQRQKKKALIGSICKLLWCKCSHSGQFKLPTWCHWTWSWGELWQLAAIGCTNRSVKIYIRFIGKSS